METIRKWAKKVQKAFGKISKKIGGKKSKRNLLGVGIDATWGLTTMPFRLVWGTGKFVKTLVKSPKKAWEQLRYEGGRMFIATAALLGSVKRGDGYWDMDRMIWGVLAWYIGSIIGAAFLSVGMVKTGLACIFVPLIIWIFSGVEACMAAWNAVTIEQWRAAKAGQKGEARVSQAKAHARNVVRNEQLAFELNKVEQARARLEEDSAVVRLMVEREIARLEKSKAKAQVNPDADLKDFDRVYQGIIEDVEHAR